MVVACVSLFKLGSSYGFILPCQFRVVNIVTSTRFEMENVEMKHPEQMRMNVGMTSLAIVI